MAKNLFIIGAGASKDFQNNMPLGEDLINYFTNLRCIIICRIVLLVFNNIDNKYSSNDKEKCYIARNIKLHDLNIFINTVNKHEVFFKSFINDKSNDTIIRCFLEKLLTKAIYTEHPEWKTERQIKREKEVIQETIDFFLKEKKYDNNLNLFQALCSFSLYCSTGEARNSAFRYTDIKLVEEFEKVLQDITKVVFKPSCIKDNNIILDKETKSYWLEYDKLLPIMQREIEKYIKQGITLSNLINYKISNTSSIDYIINFLTDLTGYNNEIAKNLKLPSIEELQTFIKLFIKRIIGLYQRDTYYYIDGEDDVNDFSREDLFNKSYIDYIYNYSNVNVIESVKGSDFIIFNYDLFLEDIFEKYVYFLGRSNDSGYLLKKLYESHIYGATFNIKERKSTGKYSWTDYMINQPNNWFIMYDSFELWRTLNAYTPDYDLYCTYLQNSYKQFRSKDEYSLKDFTDDLKLVRINPSSEDCIKQFNKFRTSDNIYILGFGFDKWNLVNLGLFNNNFTVSQEAKQLKNKKIFITDYGNSPKIRILIEDLFDVILRKESEENVELNKEQASINNQTKTYYFWKGVNKERNLKVYVSTKGVYQALKEDFGL